MIMRKIKTNKGFSLVEALFVVAIIVVLGTVIIMSIVDHMRSMEKTENDGYAKTIFVAAQNHLTMTEHEGFLGRTKFGSVDENNPGVYFYRVDNHGNKFGDNDEVLDLILPLGSVDETIRAGSYIVRYQKSSAKVLDVFYWKTEGRYAYDYVDRDYYNLLEIVDPERGDPDKLRNYDGAVIGHYGGAQIEDEPGREIDPPQIQVINDETLTVLVSKTIQSTDEKINVAIHGESSGVLKQLTLYNEGDDHWDGSNYRILLDSVTDSEKNYHFATINSDFNWKGEGDLIPGENIEIYAVAYNGAQYTNVAFSSTQVTNSLFADGNTAADGDLPDSITISSIRHLENLDPRISDYRATADAEIHAVQTVNLDWTEFAEAIDDHPGTVKVFDKNGNSSTPNYDGTEITGGYEPVSPSYKLDYDGKNHTISNVVINVPGMAAGLFGSPTGELNVTNLRLQDFRVSGTEAGTLAASVIGGEIRNVLACQSKEATVDASVSASGSYAGGLIGKTDGSYVEACAAAVRVECVAGDAGGLIGVTKNNGRIIGCYSAGYTEGGDYYEPTAEGTSTPIYSVRAGGNAGGLVGDCSTKIYYCYSTCSVIGNVAGGLVGVASKSIEDSYCTGLVGVTGDTPTKGAFIGQMRVDTAGPSAGHENYYFSIINYGSASAVGKVGEGADASGIIAFDQSTTTYRSFVSVDTESSKQRTPANPYDDTLVAYYQGGFNLKTVKQLGYENLNYEGSYDALETKDFVDAHYGDWPAPEILIVNVPN